MGQDMDDTGRREVSRLYYQELDILVNEISPEHHTKQEVSSIRLQTTSRLCLIGVNLVSYVGHNIDRYSAKGYLGSHRARCGSS